MNLNLVGYVLYLGITAYIIVVVGRSCYRNGNVYVAALLPDHAALCLTVNRVLLTGYYLVNLGYCGLTLVHWQPIRSVGALIETVGFRAGSIVLLLAVMHYFNLFILTNYLRKTIH